jgi:hypothetical protein
MKLVIKALLVLAGVGSSNSAMALCSHNGVLYAKTTLAQEFREANWVARVRVVSAASWQSRDGWGTTYRLMRVRSYKGELQESFNFSTERNSGGFYLDKGANPDIGGEYLMFLVPYPRKTNGPPAVRKSLWVNYACGQSRAWSEVPETERRQLVGLSTRSKN